MTDKTTTNQPEKSGQSSGKKPNDTGAFHVEGFVKIFDPKTNETFVEKRA